MQNKDQNGRLFAKPATAVVGIALCALTLALTGCGTAVLGTTVSATVIPAGLTVSGNVHGGQQPVAGSTIQLYAVGTSSNGGAATPLLNPAALSNVNGNFNIPAFTCPTGSMVYITATQGNPGLGVGGNNPALALMAALGSCTTLQANLATVFIDINEATTVAAVYALSGFISDYPSVGYNPDYLGGITNAFATSNALVNYGTGASPGAAVVSGITIPTNTINTLADAISACINSPGATSPGCTTLFGAATTSSGSVPTNTVAALVNIAHNPAANVAAIYGLVSGLAPFHPTLQNLPSDWTMPVTYTGGGLSVPSGIAMDAQGNAWVANGAGNAVTEIATGSFVSGTAGYTSSSIVGPQGLAIDQSGVVWLANTGADNLLEMNAVGGVVNTLTAGIGGPVSVAIDGSRNVWVSNFDGNSIAKFTSNGTPASGSPFTTALLSGPTGLAIDANSTVWVSNSDGNSVITFNSAGVFQSSYTDGLLIAPGGIVTDTSDNRVWTAATGINAISGLTSSGGAVPGAPLSGAGLAIPLTVALDGTGNVWAVNGVPNGSVTAFTKAGVAKTPSTGLGVLHMPVAIALDGSGNVWTASAGDNSITEFVGLGSPTLTPLVASPR